MKILVVFSLFLFQSCSYFQLAEKEKQANALVLIRYYPSDQNLEIKGLTSTDIEIRENILDEWELNILKYITNNKGILEITCVSFPEKDRRVGKAIFVMQKYTEYPFSVNKLMKGCMICYQVDDVQWNIYLNQVEFQDKRFTLKKSKAYKNQIHFEEEDEDSVTGFTAFDFNR